MNYGDERIPARIWQKITVDADGHWLWTGAMSGHPQTRWKVDGKHKTVSARRVLFEVEHGPCSKPVIAGCLPACVNPAHVRAAEVGDLEREWAIKNRSTACRNGHVFAEVGVYYSTVRGRRVRKCRLCHSQQVKAKRDKRIERKLRRMNPERRERFLRRREAQINAYRTGKIRRRDGSLSPLFAEAATP